MTSERWRAYEREVAAVFQEAGLDAEVDVLVSGARATHQVDVLVRPAPAAAAERRWLVECKDQHRSVPKSAVLTFRGVLEDIGAERGFLVSEAAFQPAAVDATSHTNITLCAVQQLREELRDLRRLRQLGSLETRAAAIRDELALLHDDTIYPTSQLHGDLFVRALNWKQWVHWQEGVSTVIDEIDRARAAKWPATAALLEPRNALLRGEPVAVNDIDAFVEVADAYLEEAGDWADAARRWLSVAWSDRTTTDEVRGLAIRLQSAFLLATRTPASLAAGTTRAEPEAAELLLRSANASVGYHAAHTRHGTRYVDADKSLYFVLEPTATICLAAERWSQGPPGASPRLVLERTHGPLSAIEVRRSDLGRATRLAFLCDATGAETGALVEFANRATVYAWVESEDEVGYSLDGFPSSIAVRWNRELVRS